MSIALRPRTRRAAAVLVVAALAATACSGSNVASPPGTRDDENRRSENAKRRDARRPGAGKPSPAATAGGNVAASPGSSSKLVVPTSDPPGTDRDPSLARASAAVLESEPDAETTGITPEYAELLRTSIEGLGADFRITLTFAADLPNEMPNDKTFMVVGVNVIGIRDNDGYAFAAQADQQGWRPYAGGKDRTSEFPGEFEIDANEIVMTVPWRYVRGPRQFRWVSSASWFQQVASAGSYSSDPLPNEDTARFPN